jgi:hypothetical protein
MVNELVSNPRFAEALGKALQKGARTKSKIDRNCRPRCHLAHVPTKTDYEDLVQKVTGLGHEVAKLKSAWTRFWCGWRRWPTRRTSANAINARRAS